MEGPLYSNSAPVVKSVPVVCLVPKLSLLCELHSHSCTTTTCMWAKLHVPTICSGHKNIMVKFTQAVAVTEIMVLFFLKKCHLSHCYIHNYKEKHLILSPSPAGIR